MAYCIYQSDPTQTAFFYVANAINEEDGRNIIANTVIESCKDKFTSNKCINLFLFEGADHISGRVVTHVYLNSLNK